MTTAAAGAAPAATEPVQPDASQQGAEGQGGDGYNGLYEETLSAAPEELRPFLETELKKLDGNVTKRLQEAAELRGRFEPLAGIDGLSDIPAEDLEALVAFHGISGDPQQFDSWLVNELLMPMGEQSKDRLEAIWNHIGEELDLFAGDGEGPDGEPDGEPEGDSEIAQLQSQLDELKQTIQQRDAQSEMTTRQQQQVEEIRSAFDAIEEEHGELDDDAKDSVRRFALTYEDEETVTAAVQKGFQHYLRVTGQAQGDLVDEKLGDQTPTPNGGGGPDTSPAEVEGFKGAKAAARERMRAGA